jgi:signal transduction histidine kinase
MENMNDMVWSMKGSDKDNMTLGTRIKNYGSELLTVQNIQCKYTIDEEVFRAFKNFESRKNILLIIKEGMNNLAKYSGATHAALVLEQIGNRVIIKITDNGTGFDTSLKPRGNGLKNMEARTRELNGHFQVSSVQGNGTVVSVDFPIP